MSPSGQSLLGKRLGFRIPQLGCKATICATSICHPRGTWESTRAKPEAHAAVVPWMIKSENPWKRWADLLGAERIKSLVFHNLNTSRYNFFFLTYHFSLFELKQFAYVILVFWICPILFLSHLFILFLFCTFLFPHLIDALLCTIHITLSAHKGFCWQQHSAKSCICRVLSACVFTTPVVKNSVG